MSFLTTRRVHAGLLALAATAALTATADASPAKEKLVVRGDATIVDGDCGPDGCPLTYQGGQMRGTLGTGAYAGDFMLKVAEMYPNGEGGVCAPIAGRMVLGAGTADRLVLAVTGDSCQDGAGPPPTSSFTGVATFRVKYGTGKYQGAHGRGLATFVEGADDHDRMTLVGTIGR